MWEKSEEISRNLNLRWRFKNKENGRNYSGDEEIYKNCEGWKENREYRNEERNKDFGRFNKSRVNR